MKFFLLFVAFLCGLNISNAQVVHTSHTDEIAAKKKETLSTSKSSGSAAGSNLCWASIDTHNLNMLDSNTASLCLNDSLILNADFGDESSFTYAQWYYVSDKNPMDNYYGGLDNASILVKETGTYFFHAGVCDVGIHMTSTIPLENYPSQTIICPQGAVQLTAPAGNFSSYQWYKNNAVLNGKKQKIYTANATGNYYVRVKDSNNCALNSDKINVTVYNPPAALKISGSTCMNSILSLDAYKGNLNADTIKWYRNDVLIKTFINAGTVVAGINGKGSGPRQLNAPYGIFLDSSKNIYVADYNNYRVMKYAPGNDLGQMVGGSLRSYGNPTDVVADADNVFISTTNSLVRFSSTSPLESLGGYNFWGIAIGADHDPHVTFDHIYSNGGSVSVFYKDPSSGFYNNFKVAGDDNSGQGLTHLNYPNGIYQDADYNLFIADNYIDSLNNNVGRIVKWPIGASTGQLIAGGKNYGNSPDQIWFAAGVTFDKKGNMYVSDAVNNRVQLWKPGAAHGITLVSGFRPWGIKVDDNLNLYVADQTHNKVLKFPSLFYNKISVNAPGTYKAVVTYPGGCVVTSNSFIVTNCAGFANNDELISADESKWTLNVFPNPVQTKLKVHLENIYGIASVSVIDIMGKTLATQQITASGNNDLNFTAGTLSSGVYFIQVMHNGKKMHLQFVKE